MIERWLTWRTKHDVARQVTEALVFAAIALAAWLVLGTTAGIVFAVVGGSLIVLDFVGTARKRRRVAQR